MQLSLQFYRKPLWETKTSLIRFYESFTCGKNQPRPQGIATRHTGGKVWKSCTVQPFQEFKNVLILMRTTPTNTGLFHTNKHWIISHQQTLDYFTNTGLFHKHWIISPTLDYFTNKHWIISQTLDYFTNKNLFWRITEQPERTFFNLNHKFQRLVKLFTPQNTIGLIKTVPRERIDLLYYICIKTVMRFMEVFLIQK